jgi:hypothetical protein
LPHRKISAPTVLRHRAKKPAAPLWERGGPFRAVYASATQAFCSGWLPSGDRPLMVVIFLPETCDTAVWQERVALPSMCTVQAPQRPAPQPNLVPVRLKWSRTT